MMQAFRPALPPLPVGSMCREHMGREVGWQTVAYTPHMTVVAAVNVPSEACRLT